MTIGTIDIILLRKARDELSRQIEDKSIALADGIARDYADYAKRAGQIQGLRDALTTLETIASDISGDARSEQ